MQMDQSFGNLLRLVDVRNAELALQPLIPRSNIIDVGDRLGEAQHTPMLPWAEQAKGRMHASASKTKP